MFVQEKSPEDQLIQMCDGDSVMQGGHCTWSDLYPNAHYSPRGQRVIKGLQERRLC